MHKISEEICNFYGYDYQTVMDYQENFVSCKELSFLDELEGNRKFITLTEEDKIKFDKGYTLLKQKYPELNVSYQEYQENSIMVNGQKRKLFRFLDDKKLSEEVGKWKLPNKELYLVVSNNFSDMILASTLNSWTSCIDLNGGDYKLTALQNIFLKGRYIVYLTDMTPKIYKGLSSFKMIFRSFGMINKEEEMINVLWYPGRFAMSFENEEISLKAPTKAEHSKYPIDIVKNKFGAFVYPYFDNGGVLNDCISYYVMPEERTYKPTILFNKELVEYEYLLKTKYSFERALKKHCDACGSKEPGIITLGNKNYCRECFNSSIMQCENCGEATPLKHIVHKTSGEYVCSDCASELMTCKYCGDAHDGKTSVCSFCRSKRYDIYRKRDYLFYDKQKKNFYDYEKHVLIPSDTDIGIKWSTVKNFYIKS